jgi:hypothetical protein
MEEGVTFMDIKVGSDLIKKGGERRVIRSR